uniref:Uncharacterized protein n=1 Tax=Arundo donax TaxID=35708 RepID=A0A0A8ZWZ3_ARUDO
MVGYFSFRWIYFQIIYEKC